MQLSKHVLNVKSSPTVVLNTRAKALQAEGHKVLSFAIGEPDYPTPKAVVEKTIASLQAGRTKYGPAGGSLEFRKAISAKLKRENNLEYPAEDIVVGIGAKEILFHLFMALINEGDEVLVPTPYWVSYPDQITAFGGKPVFLSPSADPANAPLDLTELAKMITPRTKGIVFNSPNNPTGYVCSREFLAEFGKIIADKKLWVISDEIYEYLAFDRPHHSLAAVCPALKEQYFHVNGMSKGYAMTGYRVGYVAGPSQVMKVVRDLQSHSSTCLPPFVEDAATFAITQGPGLLAKERESLRERRDVALKALAAIPGVKPVAPQGAFYIFVDLRGALENSRQFRDLDTLKFCDWFLSKHHVAMVPGEAFGMRGFVRMSYAAAVQDITAGISRLGTALSEA